MQKKSCQLTGKGRGVILYGKVKSCNSSICKKMGNVALVRSLPGRTTNTTRCRHCNKTETLPHVLACYRLGGALQIKRQENFYLMDHT